MSAKGKKGKSGAERPGETEIAKERRSGVDELRARLATEAEVIVHEKMPAKILELTKLLEDGELFKYPSHDDLVQVCLIPANPSGFVVALPGTFSAHAPPRTDHYLNCGHILQPVSQVSWSGGEKKRKLDELSPRRIKSDPDADGVGNGAVVKSDFVFASNPSILQQQELLKSEIQDCLQMLSKVKIWIHLNIPKVFSRSETTRSLPACGHKQSAPLRR